MTIRRIAALILLVALGAFAALGQTINPSVLPSANGCVVPSSSIACAVLNSAYSTPIPPTPGALAVIGGPVGAGTPTWSFSSGNVPPGLNIDSQSGVISGSPTQGGLYTFTVAATFATMPTSTIVSSPQYSVAISQGTLTIPQPQVLQSGTVGVSITPVTITATGGIPFVGGSGAYQWSIVKGSQADGLVIDPNTGTLSGTPTNAGVFSITIGVIDAVGSAAIHLYSFTAAGNNALSILTTSLPGAIVGATYSQTLLESGGPVPGVTWAIIAGALPTGLQISSNADSTGSIAGTPTAAGTFNFTVQASYVVNAASATTVTATQAFSIVIGAQLTMASPTAVTGTVGQSVSMQFSAVGGAAPLTYTLQSGTLPPGTGLNAQTGAITGQATQAGVFTFTVQVSDSTSPAQTASASGSITISAVSVSPVTISVGAAVLSSTPTALAAGTQPAVTISIGNTSTNTINGTLSLTFTRSDHAGSQEVRFSTGSNTVNFNVTPGSKQATLPLGFSLLTGTVAGAGTITATFFDQQGNLLGTFTVNFTVNSTAPVIKTFTISLPSNGTFTATIVGYSSTLDMTNAVFHFTPTTGTNLAATDVTVAVSPAFQTWYGSTTANPTGSQFTLKVTFTVTVTGGASSVPIAAATVTLTNSISSTTSGSAIPQ